MDEKYIFHEKMFDAQKENMEHFRQLASYQSAIIDNASYMVIVTTEEGIITMFNPAAERMLGYTAEECVGKLTPAIVHDMDEVIARAELFSEELSIQIEPGFEVFVAKARYNLPNEYEWTYIRKDGSRFPVLLSVTALRDSKQNIIGFMGIANDITNRKRAEAKLAANLWFFESMDLINRVMQGVDNIEQMMSNVLDTMISIFRCDRAFLATPCDPAQPEFTIAMERTTPEYPGAFSRAVTVPMSPDVKKLFHELLGNPNKPHEIYVGKGLDPEDIVWKTYGIQSQLAMAILPRVGDAWECGLHQCSYNRVWKPQEKKLFLEISRRLGDMLTSLLSFRNLKDLNEQLEVRVEQRTAELTYANKQMRVEIAERQKAEEDRAQAQAERDAVEVQLRSAQKLEAVGQLAAGIAHEINTPAQYVGDNIRFLNESFNSTTEVLDAYNQLLIAARNDQIFPELLSKIEKTLEANDIEFLLEQIPSAISETMEGIGRISKIVLAMKEFSHPGKKEKFPSDLNRAIETTTTVARNEWKYVAELELCLDPMLPKVPCFLGEFNQCILNLVVNAAHAIGDAIQSSTDTRGKISICTRLDGNDVEIRVKDTGTGIPKAAQPRIFDPFFTTKEVGKGTGQGLTIVYNTIVKMHNGTVTFETTPGKGTVFILRLPVHEK